MIFSEVARKAEKLIIDNSPALLTAVGVTGTVTVAYLTGRASLKAAEVLRQETDEMRSNVDILPSSREKVQLVWKLYIPAIGVGALTCACIIGANRIGTRRAAALAAAFTLSEKAFDEYKEKIVEKLGKAKEQAARDEIAQDRVNRSPVNDREVIMTGTGEVLCHDSLTGRYFRSTVESIKKAQNDINYQILHNMYASLSDFYCMIGLATTPYSEEVGWNADRMLEITFSATLSEDNNPCIVLDYVVAPIRGFNRLQ